MTLQSVLDAHGGLGAWQALARLELIYSARGFLFTAKRLPTLDRARLTVHTQHPEVHLHDYPVPGHTACFLGAARVEIRNAAGETVAFRDQPRLAFASLRHQFYWDSLDFSYFCGYAMWNYLTMPFLLAQPGVVLQNIAPLDEQYALALQARFPAGFPTHSPEQRFYFNSAGQLQRHDYTAQVVGPWAKAAHFSSDYRRFGPLFLPCERRVHPTLPGLAQPIRALNLVALSIHDAQASS